MKMKLVSIPVILILSTLVSGCLTDPAELKAKRQEEKGQQVAMDHNQCVSYGFPPNTVEYANCRMKLDQQRIEMEHQKELAHKTNDDQQPVKQIQNPGKVCNSHSCY